jgi:hypothetical protein
MGAAFCRIAASQDVCRAVGATLAIAPNEIDPTSLRSGSEV